jgi:hypothetical protein
MIVGVFHAKGLATLAPRKKAQVSFGDMTVKYGIVEAPVPYENLLSAMGIDEASALYLSSVDDISLRMVNPDIDGNGRIDALCEHRYGEGRARQRDDVGSLQRRRL